MFAHYVSVAFRQMRKAPFATFVGSTALALGLACFLTAYAVVSFWDRADAFFEKAERTYVLTQGGWPLPRNPHAGPYAEADFPELEAVARAMVLGTELAVAAGDRAIRLTVAAADSEFLEIFDLPYVAGGPSSALRGRPGVVLTRDAAERLFGRIDVLDQTVLLDASREAVVTGVIEPVPEPSHMGRSPTAPLPFDALLLGNVCEIVGPTCAGGMRENWVSGTPVITYLLLPEDGSLTRESLGNGLRGFADRHAPAGIASDVDLAFGIVPVTELLGAVSTPQRFVLIILGSLILAVGCLNFANLSASRAAFRAQEVGMRKAVGAKAHEIMLQHLLEVALATALALIVALAILATIVPLLRSAAGIDITAAVFAGGRVWIFLAVLVLSVSLVAGAYPMFVLSRIRPVSIMRPNNLQFGPRRLVKVLVGVQFAATSWFLIALAVTYQQNREIERSYRYENDPLLIVENDVADLDSETLRSELERLPEVTSTAVIEPFPWRLDTAIARFSASPGAASRTRDASVYWVSGAFFSTLDIDLLAGRVFDPQRTEDDTTWLATPPGVTPHLIIDRAMSEQLGFASPDSAAGALIYLHWLNRQTPRGSSPEPWRVIGVVEDKPLNFFNPAGASATVYRYFNFPVPQQIVRISATDVPGALAAIDRVWARLAPNVPIKRRFFDDYFERAYRNLSFINRGVSILAGIALFISTIGLFAVATSVVGRRAHEIAVRKTVGARSGEVFRLLLKSFSKPVLIGSLAAWPLALIAASEYTRLFGDTLNLSMLPFVGSLLLISVVCAAAVVRQTWLAARVLPADTLRHQ